MEKKWISTEEMMEALRKEADAEQQYRHYLGGLLCSTHWLKYSSERNLYGDSTNGCGYDWYTQEEFLKQHAGERWMRGVIFN